MRLNLGGGTTTIGGFTNVDLGGDGYCHDLSRFPWPFNAGSCTALIASHVLEHFDKAEGRLFLRECYRILAPGGVLALAVPDMDTFITARLTGNYAPLEGYSWIDLNDLMGGGEHEANVAQRHRYMYCWESLAYMLATEGFAPEAVSFDGSALGAIHTPAYRAISLYVDARKP